MSKLLHDWELPELENYLQTLLKEMGTLGTQWAHAKAQYEDLEDKKKSVLAAIKNNLGSMSEAERERTSLADNKFISHLTALSVAREGYLLAQVHYDLVKVKVDTIRTLISTRRAEISKFQP